MPNKSILVTRSSLPPIEEYISELQSIWGSAWLTNMGPLHQQFEKMVAEYLKVQNISLFTNGHMALELAIQALGLTGEVITTPFTFVSTTHAIVRNGLTPVFCDINPHDYTIDVSKIEALITDKTSAIIPVHVYGNVCDVAAIDCIAKKYGLKVIYDAAHTFGVTVNGRGIGTYGDVSMFSFHATKVFNTIEGGALTFADESYRSKFNNIKNFGITSPENVVTVGSNAKMNEFQAAMGICNLRHIDEQIALRKAVMERYYEHLEGRKGIKLITQQQGVSPNYAYFPVVFDEKVLGKTRDDLCEALKSENIYARKYFYPLTNSFECNEGLYDPNATPVAKYIADRVLTLPLYADLELNDVDRICKTMNLSRFSRQKEQTILDCTG